MNETSRFRAAFSVAISTALGYTVKVKEMTLI